MDFLVGILLIIIIILILYNFSSVSVSDNQPNNSSNTFTTKYILNMQNNNTPLPSQSQLPSPMLSKEPSALNNKVNLNAQTYDYNKYFYI